MLTKVYYPAKNLESIVSHIIVFEKESDGDDHLSLPCFTNNSPVIIYQKSDCDLYLADDNDYRHSQFYFHAPTKEPMFLSTKGYCCLIIYYLYESGVNAIVDPDSWSYPPKRIDLSLSSNAALNARLNQLAAAKTIDAQLPCINNYLLTLLKINYQRNNMQQTG